MRPSPGGWRERVGPASDARRVIGASLSGMQLARTSLDVTANDIANVSTAGFRPSRVEAAAGPDRSGAVVAAIRPAEQAPPEGLSGTDLAEETVELVLAGATYGANAAALRAQDETTGFLLDVLAR